MRVPMNVGNTVVFPELPTFVYPDILPDFRIPIRSVHNATSQSAMVRFPHVSLALDRFPNTHYSSTPCNDTTPHLLLIVMYDHGILQ
jgi:hypothetical protein